MTAQSNKPSWDDAPKWAQWLAMDRYGDWWWHEGSKPEAYSGVGCWIGNGQWGKAALALETEGWQDTLEQRPEDTTP